MCGSSSRPCKTAVFKNLRILSKNIDMWGGSWRVADKVFVATLPTVSSPINDAFSKLNLKICPVQDTTFGFSTNKLPL